MVVAAAHPGKDRRLSPAPPQTRPALALTLLAATLAAACGSPTSPEERDLEDNRRRFRVLVGGDYSCDYQNQLFSFPPIIDPVRMTVRNFRVVSIVSQRTGEEIPEPFRDLFLSVDEVFDLIERARAEGAAEIRVRYDEALGYPTETWIDFERLVADEERGFTIRNLVPEG